MFVYQASLWPGKGRAFFQGLRVLKNGFQRLAQILGDAEHHFATGLQNSLLQFGRIRTAHADTPRHVRLGNALGLPPFCYAICYHNEPLV